MGNKPKLSLLDKSKSQSQSQIPKFQTRQEI